MTGPEHYAAAERLLRRAMLSDDAVEAGYEGEIAAAQVHATLALAAATALPPALPVASDEPNPDAHDRGAWYEVTLS